jgi:protein-disulfide isomerase
MAHLTEGMAPSLGPEGAQAVVVEFGDYECLHCAVLGRRIHSLTRAGGPEFRLIYRHTPSRNHPAGRQAALVAAAAAELGRFWDLHWQLVAEGPIQDPAQVWEIAQQVGLPLDDLRALLRSGVPEQRIAEDLALANRFAVRGLPTIFVDGRRLEGAVSRWRLRSAIAAAAR